jgi:hypothetical protein
MDEEEFSEWYHTQPFSLGKKRSGATPKENAFLGKR